RMQKRASNEPTATLWAEKTTGIPVGTGLNCYYSGGGGDERRPPTDYQGRLGWAGIFEGMSIRPSRCIAFAFAAPMLVRSPAYAFQTEADKSDPISSAQLSDPKTLNDFGNLQPQPWPSSLTTDSEEVWVLVTRKDLRSFAELASDTLMI